MFRINLFFSSLPTTHNNFRSHNLTQWLSKTKILFCLKQTLQPPVSKSEATVARKKLHKMFRQRRERTCVGSPSYSGIAVNSFSSCGFLEKSETLSSLFTSFHCSLLEEAELCVCHLHDFEGFSVIQLYVKWFTISFPQTLRTYKGFYIVKSRVSFQMSF